MSTSIIILLVVVGFIAAIIVIVSKIMAQIKQGIEDGNITVTKTTTSENSTNTLVENSAPALPVRQVTYIVKTTQGMSRSSQSLQGESTSTVTKTIGARAGDGKVITSWDELSELTPQIPVRLSGKISPQNPVLLHSFVAYVEEVFQGLRNDNPVWQIAQSVTPPLLIEFAERTVQVVNESYGLTFQITEHSINGHVQGRPMYLPQNDSLICDETTGEFSRRFYGIEVGDWVVLAGAVVRTEAGVALTAENISITR